jgi:hypothetical protein
MVKGLPEQDLLQQNVRVMVSGDVELPQDASGQSVSVQSQCRQAEAPLETETINTSEPRTPRGFVLNLVWRIKL